VPWPCRVHCHSTSHSPRTLPRGLAHGTASCPHMHKFELKLSMSQTKKNSNRIAFNARLNLECSFCVKGYR
jgi:hypothetical protein